MSEHRDGSGRFTTKVSDADLLHFFEAGQRDFHSANEIAEIFSIDRSQAHRRLFQLTEEGSLERIEIGNRNVVWWRPRDIVVLIEEESGYSILDRETGVASQGETRPEALRMLAEAIETNEGDSEIPAGEVYKELDFDPEQMPSDAEPPW